MGLLQLNYLSFLFLELLAQPNNLSVELFDQVLLV